MLIVVADDFSGAAEMAGIGYRYGLSVCIQLSGESVGDAELVVIDTNTRLMNEADAISKTRLLGRVLAKLPQPLTLFKKVDSVFRGHIAAESHVLQRELSYKRILLFPANPRRGRKIVDGKYLVNGAELDKTVFATDPDYPALSSSVNVLVQHKPGYLPHYHLKPGSLIPAEGFITGDVESKQDIKEYLQSTDQYDLCVGAAECFEAFLENKGYVSSLQQYIVTTKPSFTLIINGSTVKSSEEKLLFDKLSIPQLPLPGEWKGEEFVLEKIEQEAWQTQVLQSLRENYIAAVSIDHAIKPIKDRPGLFSTYFIQLMQYITQAIGEENLHIGLTGGATASAIIQSKHIDHLRVLEEIESGCVTLVSSREKSWYTVKPGSYPWPASFLRR